MRPFGPLSSVVDESLHSNTAVYRSQWAALSHPIYIHSRVLLNGKDFTHCTRVEQRETKIYIVDRGLISTTGATQQITLTHVQYSSQGQGRPTTWKQEDNMVKRWCLRSVRSGLRSLSPIMSRWLWVWISVGLGAHCVGAALTWCQK